MIRLGMAVWAATVLAFTGGMVAGVAHAGPPPPCTFRLSAPQVVHVDGADLVTATVDTEACGWPAQPYVRVACLQVQGDDSTRVCMQARGADRAQVFTGPYRPGATYTATGRGCGQWMGNPPAPDCQILGPHTATL